MTPRELRGAAFGLRQSLDTVGAAEPRQGRSLWDDAWARLRANKAAMASLFFLAVDQVLGHAVRWILGIQG